MKQILILILILTLISCKQETSNQVTDEPTEQQEAGIQEVMSTNTYEIDFDEVEYYSFEELEIGEIFDIHDKKEENRTKSEKLLLNFAWTYDISLADTSRLKELIEIGYKKREFSQAKNGLLKAYFNKDHYLEETACEHFYRDILILKTNNKTTHFLKICFSCEDTQEATKVGNGRLYLSYYQYLEKLLKGEG